MTNVSLIEEKSLFVSAVKLFVHRGLVSQRPSHLKYTKCLMSVALELLQKCEDDPSLVIFTENIDLEQAGCFNLVNQPSILGFKRRDFLSDLASFKQPTISVWEGHQNLMSEASLAQDRANLQEILRFDWLSHYPQSTLPYNDLIVEEKSGRFNRFELQRRSFSEWEKKGYRRESGCGIVGLLSGGDHKPNIIWRKYKAKESIVGISFCRDFCSWVRDVIHDMGLEINWSKSLMWLCAENDLFLQVLAEYGNLQSISTRCPQISMGFFPLATFASSLQNFEPQIFVHIHNLSEIDIAVVN